VDPGLEEPITSIEEVFTSGTKYGFSSIIFDRNFNDKSDSKAVEILENRIKCDDIVTCLLWTVKYRNISTICASGYVKYMYYNSQYSDEFRGYQPCLLKDMPVLVTDLLMALQKGSPFLDRMNDIIDRLVETGIVAYFGKFSSQAKILFKANSNNSKTVSDKYYVLTMNNMQCAFYLFLLGNSLSLISFLMEMLYFKMYVKRH
jgi:hypothetical protein